MCVHWIKCVRLNRKDVFEKHTWYDIGNRHASRRQRGLLCDFECLPMCYWAPLTRASVTPLGCT